MRLVPIPMDLWKAAQRWEAAERGYTVSFLTQGDRVVARFFNREFYLYERVFDTEGSLEVSRSISSSGRNMQPRADLTTTGKRVYTWI
jgi:hypothetical protein